MADGFTLDADAFVASAVQRLDGLGEAMGESALRQAAVAGARVFQDDARLRAPVRSGVLARNIIIKHIPEQSEADRLQVYFVTVRHGSFGQDGDAFYWRWVEFGHQKSRPKAAGTSWAGHRAAMQLEFGSSRVAARPYMRPAFESRRDAALQAMRDRLREAVDAALQKFHQAYSR
ncbi:HK97 gp10 family phage protein [Xylophilus rhododendri]|uniref:HK97 gp10 family phage protein n=1 Tax=Xylophilus rhododendri TaxID=2697032 RepID=UPI001E3B446E|nr:HK97 gp10 family phage protein [Xylophilus rhododendri]